MHRCERTVVGKPERRLGLAANRVVGVAVQDLGSVGDPAGDKDGSLRTAGWNQWTRF